MRTVLRSGEMGSTKRLPISVGSLPLTVWRCTTARSKPNDAQLSSRYQSELVFCLGLFLLADTQWSFCSHVNQSAPFSTE